MCPCVGGGYTRGSGFTRGQEGISEGGYVQEAGIPGGGYTRGRQGVGGYTRGGQVYQRGIGWVYQRVGVGDWYIYLEMGPEIPIPWY